MKSAKTKEKWDPINESLEIFMDIVIIFMEIVKLLTEFDKESKKDDNKKDWITIRFLLM